MCLGIPGQIVDLDPTNDHLASVDVAGVVRRINIGLLEDDPAVIGDWVLIHVGFAMSKIDEAEAKKAMSALIMLGQGVDDELVQLLESRIE
ncbi:MAG: HypC/HybG/HupF family hydrogenase formation chaperone [Ilumatobacteraceae bacterium]